MAKKWHRTWTRSRSHKKCTKNDTANWRYTG